MGELLGRLTNGSRRRAKGAQKAVAPASTGIAIPVTKEERSEHSQATASATSLVSPNEWSRRLGILLAATLALGALLPLLGPIDEWLFLAVNSLGDGPGWLYWALDPHSRNYVLLAIVAVAAAAIGGRRALGTAVAVIGAAFLSDLLLQAIYVVFDRPRPEEVLGAEAALTHGRSWAELASFPSGHLTVTTAMAVAAMSAVPALRTPLWLYVGAIAMTRITFGAHFPLDVAAGAFFGYEVGRFSAALSHALGLLPAPAAALPRRRRLTVGHPHTRSQP